jgi:RNA polymerase sigma factor (sigma-70 family)
MGGSGNNAAGRLATAAVRCQPDSRLVGLVREGHDLAFEEIVRRYRASLVSFAGAIVPHDHAEDVVQEALTKAHRALDSGDAEINLRPWLYTIVRNRALNTLRDEPVHDHLDENFDGVPQPPDVAARREELAALIAAVKRLPAPQREAIVGRELEGRSHEEIAKSLGTSPGAVRGLIYRARTSLRDGLGLLIPLPLLRAVLGSGPAGSDAASAGGAAAAGLAAGGGGVAMKAGATLGIAVIAVGSGIAIQHRGSKPDPARAAVGAHAGHGAVARSARSRSPRVADEDLFAKTRSGRGGPRSEESGARGEDGGPNSSSGPGHSGRESSGEGSSGSGESGHSGPGGGGDDGSSGTSGDDGGGSGSSGSGDDGGGGSGTSGGGDDNSGPGGGGEVVGADDGGGDNSGPGGGDDQTTTTTTTTTTTSDGGGGGEGPG